MAKLSIEIDENFQTDGFCITKNFEDVFLKGSDAIKYLNNIDNTQMCLVVVAYDKDNPYSLVKFDFKISEKKSKDKFEIEVNPDGSGLSVIIQGSFSVKLRSGAESVFTDKNKLKILGIEYLGGSYRGFSSYISGYDKENAEHWRDVNQFKIA
jgi:hypothetical protein